MGSLSSETMSLETKPKTRRKSSVQEHARKASKVLDSWGKGISRGISKSVTKTKHFAIEKVVKVEPTQESKQMLDALAQLNKLKTTIDSLSDGTISNLYNSQSNESIFNLKLSETFMSLQSNEQKDDLFNNFAENVMGRKLFKLNTLTTNYLVKMEKEIINPINSMKNSHLKKAYELIKKYKSIKTDYDFAVHKLHKLTNNTKKTKKKKKKKNWEKKKKKKKKKKS